MSRPTFSVLCAVALFLGGTPAVAQSNLWNVTVPSPTAASLGKYGDVPVSLYTGVPGISVPIFTVKGKTLELPIALSYHGSGLKVEELGGWVGMGWSLEAGGVITRNVRGLVDESSNGYWNAGFTYYDPNNWPGYAPSWPNGSPAFASWWSLLGNVANNGLDGEPDQFFFNFAGHSGEFVMGPTSTTATSRIVRTIPYQDWRIVPTIISNRITQFEVTTEDGTKYTFAATETHLDQSSGHGPLYNIPYYSSWYLTQVQSTGGDVIGLQYQGYKAFHQMGTSGEQLDENSCGSGGLYTDTKLDSVFSVRLTTITAAAHTITFYSDSLRQDALSGLTAQEPRLDRIVVSTPSGTVLRRFQLGYDYSIGAAGAPRLTLKSLAEQDRNGVSLPPYNFTYSGPQLPPRDSYAVDHWGYFNGKSNSSYVPSGQSPSTPWQGHFYAGADRNPDSAYTKAGMLTRITYPTGGFNDFVYEPNDYGNIYALGQMTDSGAPVTVAVNTSSTMSTTFTISGYPASVDINVFFSNAPGTCPGVCPYAEIVGVGHWTSSNSYHTGLAPGTYQMSVSQQGDPTFISLSVRLRGLVDVKRKTGGGLRIREIRTSDGMGGMSIRKYRYVMASDTARSSGLIESEPKYDFAFSGSPFVLGSSPPPCQFFSRTTHSAMPLGGGNPVVYYEVTVWDGANGEYGRTRHAFHLGDRPPEFTTWGAWPYHRRTSFYWRWGQETWNQVYDSSNRIQRSSFSAPSFPSDTNTVRELRGITVKPSPVGPTYSFGIFRIESARKNVASETVTTYDTTGTTSISSTKYYSYDNPRHGQVTQIAETNSDGKQRITRLKYPQDYGTGSGSPETSALTAMQDSIVHMHSQVIERSVSEKVGGSDKVVQAEITTYRLFGVGQYLPYQRFILNSPTPIP